MLARLQFRFNICLNSIYLIQFHILTSYLNGIIESSFIMNSAGVLSSINNHTRLHLDRHKCQNHLNCSLKIFSLESYCCESIESCCTWLEYIATYNKSNSTLIYKGPTLLTILTLLILFILLMFVLYCFVITFCYCFKCGLFRKPKIIIISETATNGSDSTSADIITPKSSSTSSSLSSASEISYSNRHHSNVNRHNPHNQRGKKTSIVNNHHYRRHRYQNRSPKARVLSTGGASSNSTTTSNHNRQHHQRLFADPNCYIDLENESPFLVPEPVSSRPPKQRSTQQSNQRSSAANRNQRTSATTSTARTVTTAAVTNQRNENRIVSSRQLDTIQNAESSSSSASSRSSSSIDFHLVNAQSSLSVNNPSAHVTSSGLKSAPSYYLDEKPPSYDDIINNIGKN